MSDSAKKCPSAANCSMSEVAIGEDDLATELIYWLPENVQLVTIQSGTANTPSPPTSLAIFKILNEKSDVKSVVGCEAVICVGPWAYPLSKEKSAVMKNEFGVYVFPNPTAEHPEMCVGLILPPDIPKELEDEFVYAIGLYATVRLSESSSKQLTEGQKTRTSERIAALLIKSGELLSQGTQMVSTRASDYMTRQGESFRSGLDQSGEPVCVNPAVRYGVRVMYFGGKMASKTTRYLLDRIGDMGLAIGRQIARRFENSSANADDGSGNKRDERMSTRRIIRGAVTVVSGGAVAASTVWISLENASKTLLRCIADETVKTVDQKYGTEASDVVHHGLYAVGHGTLAGFQIYEMGPRSIAGKMARKAGLQVAQSFAPSEQQPAIKQLTAGNPNNSLSSANDKKMI